MTLPIILLCIVGYIVATAGPVAAALAVGKRITNKKWRTNAVQNPQKFDQVITELRLDHEKTKMEELVKITKSLKKEHRKTPLSPNPIVRLPLTKAPQKLTTQ